MHIAQCACFNKSWANFWSLKRGIIVNFNLSLWTRTYSRSYLVTQSYNKHWTVYCIYKKNLNMTNILYKRTLHTCFYSRAQCTQYIPSTSTHTWRQNEHVLWINLPHWRKKKSSTLVNALAFKSTGFSLLLYISIYVGPKCSFVQYVCHV